MRTHFFLLASLLTFSTAQARPDHLTDPEIARKLGITVQQVHDLRGAYNLSNDDLVNMSGIQLQTLLFDVSHPGIDKHAEEQNFRALRMMDEHGHIPPNGLLNAMEHRRHMGADADLFPGSPEPSTNVPTFGEPGPMVAGIQTNGWTWLGPGNIGGRVRAILPHPTLTNVLYCGGVDGGVWKSTNSGAAWFPLNDFMGNLAVACLVMDPTNSNIIYAGTGEPAHNADAIRGAGIFKTTDAGATWTQLASTANSSFLYVGRLAIDPNNSLIVLAATRSGVFRSTDGGTSWSQRSATEVLNVTFHPTDSSQCLAGGYNGHAYYSMDGGQTWFSASGLPAPTGLSGRTEVAYARSSPTTVFASVDNSSGQVYVSGDGGQTYALRSSGYNFLGGQGWYDNVVWIDPTTTNVLVVGGGPDLWRSTDGGATFTKISQWQSAPASAHADHHAIVAHPSYNGTTIRTVYFGNDGGVYRANDVYAVSLTSGWQSLNNNLGITQFYGGAGNSNTLVLVGGTQDNGSLRYTTGGGPQGWTAMFGGDGGYSAADPTDPNYFYGEYVYLQIHRSSNGGASSSYIYSGITDAGSAANFIAPFILDPNNPNTMLGGGMSLWRSTNVKAATPTWAAIKPSISSAISAIAVAPGNSDIIWVGHNNGGVYYTTNGTAVTPTWYQRNLGTPNLPARKVGRIAVVAGNPNQVYATFGGYNPDNVWLTMDSGVTWTNISNNLPAAPMNSIVIAPGTTNVLYVGSDVGVYGSANNGVSWSTGNDGPANVAVDELFWLGNKLVAVTHGRGMFYTTPTLGGAALAAISSSVIGGNGNGAVDPNECNQLKLIVQNVGGTNATNISAVLSTTTPGVTVVQGASSYPNLPTAATGTNNTLFQISTSPTLTCGTPVAVTLTLTFNGTTNVLTYTLPGSAGGGYVLTQTTGASIVPGVTDTGNHGDDVTTTISLPFGYNFFSQTFSNATLSSNGNLQFNSADNQWGNSCLPYGGFNYSIVALWDDLRTDQAGGGIFTSISGSAPNRIFNIEWRAIFYASNLGASFEVRLYEGQPRLDIIYGALSDPGSSATVGIQSDTGSSSTNVECNVGGLSAGLQLTFQQVCPDGGGGCGPSVTANFTGGPLSGAAPLTVSFTNSSSGATNYNWTFGDGNTSSATNPANVYVTPGIYSVSLAAIGSGVTNTLTRNNYITVTNLPPVIILNPLQSGNSFIFSFNTVGGKTYSVQYKNALTDPLWQTLQSIPGDGTLKFVTNSLAAPSQRFYRLSVQ